MRSTKSLDICLHPHPLHPLCGFTFSFPLVQQTWPGDCPPPSSHFFSHPPFPLSPTAPACVETTSRIWQRRPPAYRDGTLPESWIPYVVRTSYCPNGGYVVRGFLPIIIKPPPHSLCWRLITFYPLPFQGCFDEPDKWFPNYVRYQETLSLSTELWSHEATQNLK